MRKQTLNNNNLCHGCKTSQSERDSIFCKQCISKISRYNKRITKLNLKHPERILEVIGWHPNEKTKLA